MHQCEHQFFFSKLIALIPLMIYDNQLIVVCLKTIKIKIVFKVFFLGKKEGRLISNRYFNYIRCLGAFDEYKEKNDIVL